MEKWDNKTLIMTAYRLDMIQSVFPNKGPLDLSASHLLAFHFEEKFGLDF